MSAYTPAQWQAFSDWFGLPLRVGGVGLVAARTERSEGAPRQIDLPFAQVTDGR